MWNTPKASISADMSKHPNILRARWASINHTTLVNDLYSFPKELDAKEAVNAIPVLIRREDLDLQNAVNKVVQLIY
jgi:hypothetical protein